MAIAPSRSLIFSKSKSVCPYLSFHSFSPSSLSFSFRSRPSQSNFLGRSLRISGSLTINTLQDPRIKVVAAAASSNLKLTILVSEKLGEAGIDLLRSFTDVDCSYNLFPQELCSKIVGCDALIVRSGTKVTRQVFEAGKGRLKVVGMAGVGIDNVDLHATTEFGCLVVIAPTANTVAAAEHGITLLASMAWNVAQADAFMKSGWKFSMIQQPRLEVLHDQITMAGSSP